jgi:ABC-type Fe3+ transport system permease subunit
MVERSVVETAERLSRKRARMLPFLAVIYLCQQATFFAGDAPPGVRSVDHVKIGAWLVLSLVLLLALATNGFWFQSKEVRDLINDESTRANRASAMTAGFVAAMLAAMAVYFIEQFEPVSSREAIHVILSLGLGAALVRFGMLERRAHDNG